MVAATNGLSQSAYVKKWQPLAEHLREDYGIPVAVILGIAIHESGSGTSKHAKLLNNHFGIKGKNKLLKEKGIRSAYKQYDNVEECYEHFCKIIKKKKFYHKQKIDAAKWFIDAIKQRQHTLLSTMNAIMQHQHDFFLTGDETTLRPMILKDIAEKTGLDISTVSRVANSKFVQTEFGTYRLKFFFSESLSTESGEEVSTREVKKILSDLIEAENKKRPLSDERLTELLQEKGYNIARRTVAKYREQLNIPVARLRKEL